jgi:hypothetical protein
LNLPWQCVIAMLMLAVTMLTGTLEGGTLI